MNIFFNTLGFYRCALLPPNSVTFFLLEIPSLPTWKLWCIHISTSLSHKLWILMESNIKICSNKTNKIISIEEKQYCFSLQLIFTKNTRRKKREKDEKKKMKRRKRRRGRCGRRWKKRRTIITTFNINKKEEKR